MAPEERLRADLSAPARLRVLVLCGGRSAEHEISLLSARFICASLQDAGYEVVVIGIDKAGRWRHLSAVPEGDATQVAIDTTRPVFTLSPFPETAPALRPMDVSSTPIPFDVVFPVLHGPFGEDGSVQGLLELAGVPYVGSGVTASALGMDKVVQKRLLEAAGVPVVPYVGVDDRRWQRDPDEVLLDVGKLACPLFVKPSRMGSSLGISRVEHPSAIGPAIDLAFQYDDTICIEKGLVGLRELECAVLGTAPPRVSPMGEIEVQTDDGFYSYDAKYLDPDAARLHIPADVEPTVSAEMRGIALRAFESLGLEGLARIDFFLDAAGRPFLNEVNTMPGFTSISMYPALFAAEGLAGPPLTSLLVELARARHARRQGLRTSR
ncbi:MAG: D-alanine--D-alanine ligase family protein [Myxococcota bacterium]